ncbi:MAG: DinB family protein [Balneolaceae bacterium]
MKQKKKASQVIDSEQALEHWQGHRNLTRRMIDVYPEEKLFTYSIGGMRPFSELVMEMIHIAGPGVKGLATGEWEEFGEMEDAEGTTVPETKEELLKLWDWCTDQINRYWPEIEEERFQEEEVAFGQYEGQIWSHLCYFIDNEIHHRGQGYVYLRSLGIEPPYFWERE